MERTIWSLARTGATAELSKLVTDPDAEVPVDLADDHGVTALMHAEAQGQEECVCRLLEVGANAALQDRESGYSALHRAFLGCKLATAAALVRAGVSVHEPLDHEGLSPLELLHKVYGERPLTSSARLPFGEVYTWGDAGCVALGRAGGSHARTASAGRVETGGRIVGLAAGKYHTLLIDSVGHAHACGLGVGGRLGVGDEVARAVPCRILLPAGRRVLCVAAGLDHSLLVTACGELYAWGAAGTPLGFESAEKDAPTLSPRRVKLPPATHPRPSRALSPRLQDIRSPCRAAARRSRGGGITRGSSVCRRPSPRWARQGASRASPIQQLSRSGRESSTRSQAPPTGRRTAGALAYPHRAR